MGQYQRTCLALFDSFLTAMMTFPLYIINLSFLLEKVDSLSAIPYQNIAQLIFSVINMIWNPIKYTKHATSYSKAAVIWFGAAGNCCSKIRIIVSAAFLYAPLVLIEVIHFFPFLFCYYVDHTVGYDDLVNILLIFNIPKLLFLFTFLFGHCYYMDIV